LVYYCREEGYRHREKNLVPKGRFVIEAKRGEKKILGRGGAWGKKFLGKLKGRVVGLEAYRPKEGKKKSTF